jgi:Na+/phosphate symporter
MLRAAPALIAMWSLAGFYGALGPAIVYSLIGHNSFVLGGLAMFALAGTGAVTVPVLRNVAPRLVMLIGIGALIVGMAITRSATPPVSDQSDGQSMPGRAFVELNRSSPW